MAAHVTAIVLTYCNETEAAACLESLARSRYENLTVLLVDNASPDGSADRLRQRFPNVEYVQTGFNGGYTAGNNRGIAWALARGTDYLLVLNDDTEVDPDCIPRLVATAEETGAGVVSPQIPYFDEPDVVWYAGGDFSVLRALGTHQGENGPRDATTSRRPVSFVTGCCFLVRADAIRRVGGFDESFFTYVEDAELSFRLTRAGFSMLYEPRAIVLHRIGRTVEPTPKQIRLRDRNRRRLVARHYGPVDRIRFGAWFYPTRVVHVLRYAARCDWERASATLDGMLERVHPLDHRALLEAISV